MGHSRNDNPGGLATQTADGSRSSACRIGRQGSSTGTSTRRTAFVVCRSAYENRGADLEVRVMAGCSPSRSGPRVVLRGKRLTFPLPLWARRVNLGNRPEAQLGNSGEKPPSGQKDAGCNDTCSMRVACTWRDRRFSATAMSRLPCGYIARRMALAASPTRDPVRGRAPRTRTCSALRSG